MGPSLSEFIVCDVSELHPGIDAINFISWLAVEVKANNKSSSVDTSAPFTCHCQVTG
jgi:hypothetical protein